MVEMDDVLRFHCTAVLTLFGLFTTLSLGPVGLALDDGWHGMAGGSCWLFWFGKAAG